MKHQDDWQTVWLGTTLALFVVYPAITGFPGSLQQWVTLFTVPVVGGLLLAGLYRLLTHL